MYHMCSLVIIGNITAQIAEITLFRIPERDPAANARCLDVVPERVYYFT